MPPRRLLSLILPLLLVPSAASAHPLGLTSINRYAGIRVGAEDLEIAYLLDFAEMPAWVEIERLDADHDEQVTPQERDRYLEGLLARLAEDLSLAIGGEAAVLHAASSALQLPPGQNGLSTLLVAIEFRAPLPAGGKDVRIAFSDRNFAGRSGWRQIELLGSERGIVVDGSVPPSSRAAGAGIAYPPDAARAPLRQDEVVATYRRVPDGVVEAPGRPPEMPRAEADASGARLAALVRAPDRSVAFLLAAFALAFALGAGHAFTPGHGKTLVAAYLVGVRARVRDALVLGASVTIAHTASVLALGVCALLVEQTLGTDRLLAILEVVAGLLVVAIAASQLPGRVRLARATGGDAGRHEHEHGGHEHGGHEHGGHEHGGHQHGGHEHGGHEHEHEGHRHDHGDGKVHSHAGPGDLRGLVALGVSGGIVPCPGALVVLLTALSLGRLAMGVALLLAFSLGLASVLSGLGVLFVLARERFEVLPSAGRLARVLPVVSSVLVLALGLGMALRPLVG